MRRFTLKLHNTKIVVLDEADEMLDMGFREDIEKIWRCLRTPDPAVFCYYSQTNLELQRNI